MSQDAPLLSVRGLTLSSRDVRDEGHILRGIDLDVRRGSILGIVGESGSGKSSLVNCITGLLPRSLRARGEVRLDGVDLLALAPAAMRDIRGRRIAMIFQDPMTALNPVFTIGTQLVDVVRRRDPSVSMHEAQERVAEALAKVGLADVRRRAAEYPGQFSGGMRQRAMIAMALLCRPDILIADEPTTALDATIEAQIIQLLLALRDELSGSIIFISHNLGAVAQLCDHVAVLYGGRLVEDGSVEDVLIRPLHPYTRALVGCEVDDQPPDVPLAFIPGKVPEPGETLPGCVYAPRCNFALSPCMATVPELRAFPVDRRAACIRVEELA